MALLLLSLSTLAAGEGAVTVRPADNGAGLANPDMGWVLHYYDNEVRNYGSRLAPADTVDDFPGLTTIYLRLAWSFLEPEEGRFNWAILDGPAQRWLDRGKQLAFRITCSETPVPYATPRWVEAAGAKGHRFTPGQGVDPEGSHWEPDYNDPIFLDKLDQFLAAFAARYDGRPEVAWVDVGTFGVWGEGHTYHSSALGYDAETVIRHIDLHRRHFTRTLLAANDDYVSQGRGEASIAHALATGLTLRDDSILVQGGDQAYFHAAMAEPFWPRAPVILESEHYGPSRDRGHWGDGSQYLQAVEEYHASYASIHWWPHEFLAECRPLIDAINLRLGYRLQVTEASWPAALRLGDRLPVRLALRNAGVAPCYPGGQVAITLKDSAGGIAGAFVVPGLDVRSLPVGPPGQAPEQTVAAEFELPFELGSGEYSVYVSVGTAFGNPTLALPLDGDDGHRRYRLGALTVRGRYGLTAGAVVREGDHWRLPLTWTVHEPLPEGVKPFLHFEQAGRIVFQGFPVGDGDLTALARPGEVRLDAVFTVPAEARGQTFSLLAGLFQPTRMGQADERISPDGGRPDRRVPLGRVTVGEDGTVRIEGP